MIDENSQIQRNAIVDQTPEQMIIRFLSTNETITRPDVEQITGTSTASASRILRRMVQNGAIIRIGAGKNTKYRLNKS